MFILDARTFRDAPIPPAASMGDVARYLEGAFAEGRAMLGDAAWPLKADLLAAEADGIVWKFIVIPEPIQHLAFGTATDRFEGYAAERAELLRFLINHCIDNVVS
ncbi:MAG: alkaline phosphatase D family protein [Caldilineaceae bacterium]